MGSLGEPHGSISIHAPREGSDPHALQDLLNPGEFLSTLPARGATLFFLCFRLIRPLFLSTLPARGATLCTPLRIAVLPYFYPRSPRGERQELPKLSSSWIQISIHAPREGSDPEWSRHSSPIEINFYPRSPRGERPIRPAAAIVAADFYPRSPRGERLLPVGVPSAVARFLSTLPARGATETSGIKSKG